MNCIKNKAINTQNILFPNYITTFYNHLCSWAS